MKLFSIYLILLLFSSFVMANELDLRTATSTVASSNSVMLTDLTYNNEKYTVVVYFNLDGTWSLTDTGNINSLDLTKGSSEIIGANAIKFSRFALNNLTYDATVFFDLAGTFSTVDVGLSDGFSVSSPAVKSSKILPFSYTCDGLNNGERGGLSPALTFNNAPPGTVSYALTMHTTKGSGDNITTESLWLLYDIPASSTSLEAGQTTIGTMGISEQGNQAYFAPCSREPIENFYTITVYALPSLLGLDPTTTDYATLTSTAQNKALDKTTLTLSNTRYNPDDSSDQQVPTSVPKTCIEKSKAFNAYNTTSVSCNSTHMTITSSTGIPERSNLDEDKLNVGTEAWIGRVPLIKTTTWEIPLVPDYLSAISNNISIHDAIGVTVDGIPILHYAKESTNGEIANLAQDYSDRDTVLLGELDQCGAHAGNGEDYHYHYAPLCMMDTHDPSQPLAYMFDGIPLYFGTAGGTVTSMGGSTKVNYGGGRYTNLDYRPNDVKTGTKSLDACNAYDINGDGTTSGYIYYTTKEAPYTIGCYRAVADQQRSAFTYPRWGVDRNISWSGADVLITDYYQSQFENKTWYYMEMTPGEGNNKLTQGNTGVILYRQLFQGETGFIEGSDCWSFRYRLDKSDTTGSNDITEIQCR